MHYGLKYVRHEHLGFAIWPAIKSDRMTHSIFGSFIEHEYGCGIIISAGWVRFSRGNVICYGGSLSMDLSSLSEDGTHMSRQLEHCKYNYVRHEPLGFVLWPQTRRNSISHNIMSQFIDETYRGGTIVSEGIICSTPKGFVCCRTSDSPINRSSPADIELLELQLKVNGTGYLSATDRQYDLRDNITHNPIMEAL